MKTLIVSGAQGTKGQTMSPIELLWTAYDNDDDGYYDEYNNYYDVLNLTQFAQFTEVYIVLSLESIQKRLLTRTFSLR